MKETLLDLYKDLRIEGDPSISSAELLVAGESRYVRELRMNVRSVLENKILTAKEAYLTALSIAVNQKNKVLSESFEKLARENEANDAEIAEAIAVASLLSANNVLYRYRHFVEKESYQTMRAGLRMNIMSRPVMGKEFFELLSLAVSAVNGCEMCVKSHEASVLEAGGSEERIWEVIRIASVISSLDRIIN